MSRKRRMRRYLPELRTGSSVWYPSVDDAIRMNMLALQYSGDKHPHKLLSSPDRVQTILNHVKMAERNGLSYQAALMMKEFVRAHPFAGANHRTAFGLASTFLSRNEHQLCVSDFEVAYPFIRTLESRSLSSIQEWIEHGSC